MLSSASGEKQLMACVSVIQTMENGVGIGVGEGVGIGVGAGVALRAGVGEGAAASDAESSGTAGPAQPASRAVNAKNRSRGRRCFFIVQAFPSVKTCQKHTMDFPENQTRPEAAAQTARAILAI